MDICGLCTWPGPLNSCVSSMPIPPSFYSFPPSFSSFPDLGNSSRKDSEITASSTPPAQQQDYKDENKQSDRKKRKRDRRDKSSNLGQIPSNKRRSGSHGSQCHGQVFDDERIKAEEDSARRAGQQDDSQLVFFSDKKGDPLNTQYGGIYSKDLPKYHLAGCE